MGIVAPRAGRRPADGVLRVGLLELGAIRVVATGAQWDFRFDEEILLVGAVGVMAGGASLRRRRFVDHFLLMIGLVVTLEAGLIPLGL